METVYTVIYKNAVESEPALEGGSFLTDAPKTDGLKLMTFGTRVFEVEFIDNAEKKISAIRIR